MGIFQSKIEKICANCNKKFVRYWFEVSHLKFHTNATSCEDSKKSNAKWFPYNKGGNFRKWYGMNEYVVDWYNDGFNIKKDKLDKQYIEHSQCQYLIGPFNTAKDIVIEDLIQSTIKKGNKQGMYGNELVNIKIYEGGYTTIISSKLCLYIKGNIIYTK